MIGFVNVPCELEKKLHFFLLGVAFGVLPIRFTPTDYVIQVLYIPTHFCLLLVLNYRIIGEFLCLTPCILCRFFSKRWLVWYLGVEAFRRALPALHFRASGSVMPPLSFPGLSLSCTMTPDCPWLACHPNGRWATLLFSLSESFCAGVSLVYLYCCVLVWRPNLKSSVL